MIHVAGVPAFALQAAAERAQRGLLRFECPVIPGGTAGVFVAYVVGHDFDELFHCFHPYFIHVAFRRQQGAAQHLEKSDSSVP